MIPNAEGTAYMHNVAGTFTPKTEREPLGVGYRASPVMVSIFGGRRTPLISGCHTQMYAGRDDTAPAAARLLRANC
jgi:hypothetical protein